METDAIADIQEKIQRLQFRRDEIESEIFDLTAELERLQISEAEGTQKINPDNLPERLEQLTLIDTIQATNQATDTKQLMSDSSERLVSKSSPIEERYKLFLSLFAGRPDVHARRWQSKAGKIGYSPDCNNKFIRAYCPKGVEGSKRVHCMECPNKSFPTITLELFEDHIKGVKDDCSDVLGAYPTDSDNKCSFIIADFDNEDRKTDEKAALLYRAESFEMLRNAAIAFRRTCLANGVPAYLEISRSGNGIHVWIFFSDKVEARKARQLCSSILTHAMNEYPDIRFTSYDRLIPSQDTLPEDGVGNLVALPLQGRAGKKCHSLFVDEELNHYPDQWEYLSAIKKISAYDVDGILTRIPSSGSLGELLENEEDEKLGKPWEKKKPEPRLTENDAVNEIEIVYANMIHVAKSGLSQRAINRIRRLGAFKNPAFYRAQAQRKSIWNIPRIISTAEETPEYISLPRGAEPALSGLLDESGVRYRYEDKTTPGNPINVSFWGQLQDEQMLAAEAMSEHNIGVLDASTAFGKTVVGIYLISKKMVNTLILVDRKHLLEHWRDQIDQFLEIDEELPVEYTSTGRKRKKSLVGEYSGDRKNRSGIIDLAIFQSLYREGEVKDFVKDYGMVIIDECHHVPAASYEAVLKEVNAKYVYGLSATLKREDGHHVITFLECGPVRYRVDAIAQAKKRPFDHFVVPRFTGFFPVSTQDVNNYTSLVSDLIANESRNRMIVDDIVSVVKDGRNPLVITERIEHASLLMEALSMRGEQVIKLTGGMSTAEKNAANQLLRDPDAKIIIVAIGKYIGEGFDCPRLDTLFLTIPIKSKTIITQYTGRLHRLVQDKADVMVYDYVDANIEKLEGMYHRRIQAYKSVGYKTITHDRETEEFNIIFASDEYLDPLFNDVKGAEREIVFSSPLVSNQRITELMPALSANIINNVVITVATKPPEEHVERFRASAGAGIERLQGAGINVVLESELHQKYVVVDQHIVWYGSINPLAFGNKEENIIRLDSADVALSLLYQNYGRKPRKTRATEYMPKQISLFDF